MKKPIHSIAKQASYALLSLFGAVLMGLFWLGAGDGQGFIVVGYGLVGLAIGFLMSALGLCWRAEHGTEDADRTEDILLGKKQGRDPRSA